MYTLDFEDYDKLYDAVEELAILTYLLGGVKWFGSYDSDFDAELKPMIDSTFGYLWRLQLESIKKLNLMITSENFFQRKDIS